jgi:hypothetical protein
MDAERTKLERAARQGDLAAATALRALNERSMTIDAALERFVDAVNAKLVGYYEDHYPRLLETGANSVLSIDPNGKRYTRIVSRSANALPGELGGSVYCFVDRQNGNLLKAAGWKAPEPKKHPRGNVYNADPTVGCGPYGVAYLNGGGCGGFPARKLVPCEPEPQS